MDPMVRDQLGNRTLVIGAVAGRGLCRHLPCGAADARRSTPVAVSHSGSTTILCAFPALWVVLIGPALVIVLHPAGG
jgi:hypothetical protein